MKKFNQLAATICVSFAIIFAISTIPSDQLLANNGTDVVMVKNNGYIIGGGCLTPTRELSSSTQFKDGALHLLRINFDLSGSCVVPEKGVNRVLVGTVWGQATMIVTPSGIGVLKLVLN